MSKERTDTERMDFAERMIAEHSQAGQAFRDGVIALMRNGALADTFRGLVDLAIDGKHWHVVDRFAASPHEV